MENYIVENFNEVNYYTILYKIIKNFNFSFGLNIVLCFYILIFYKF